MFYTKNEGFNWGADSHPPNYVYLAEGAAFVPEFYLYFLVWCIQNYSSVYYGSVCRKCTLQKMVTTLSHVKNELYKSVGIHTRIAECQCD